MVCCPCFPSCRHTSIPPLSLSNIGALTLHSVCRSQNVGTCAHYNTRGVFLNLIEETSEKWIFRKCGTRSRVSLRLRALAQQQGDGFYRALALSPGCYSYHRRVSVHMRFKSDCSQVLRANICLVHRNFYPDIVARLLAAVGSEQNY